MTFYRDCLGGELQFQTVADSPLSEQLPHDMKKFILHSTLSRGSMVIMATDIVAEQGLVKGNSVALMLNCDSENEMAAYYNALSSKGQAIHPPEETFWGSLFAGLIDKFGNHWLLHFEKSN
jgi:PhnB protein